MVSTNPRNNQETTVLQCSAVTQFVGIKNQGCSFITKWILAQSKGTRHARYFAKKWCSMLDLIIYSFLLLEGGDMLIPVEFKGVSKWVRVPKTDDAYNYSEFLQGGHLSVVIKSN